LGFPILATLAYLAFHIPARLPLYPLGGNQVRPSALDKFGHRSCFLGGLWHGAAWTFGSMGFASWFLFVVNASRAACSNTKSGQTPWRLGSLLVRHVCCRLHRVGCFSGHPISRSLRECWAVCLVDIRTATPFLPRVRLLQIALDRWNDSRALVPARYQHRNCVMRTAALDCDSGVGFHGLRIILTQGNSNAFIYFQF